MKKNKSENLRWESLCKQCGKCCHRKFDLVIYAIADPEYICQYLNQDNRCNIYEKRLTSDNNCMALKNAVKKSGLLPNNCGYIHINSNHQPLIMPVSIEDFWKLVKIAEIILNKKTGKNIDLVSLIDKDRKNNNNYKTKKKI